MKIICVIDSLGSGGAQRQIVELAKGLKQKGNDVSFVIYHNISFFKTELDAYEINVKVIEESNYIKRILKIRNYIRNSDVDGVISFLEGANFICELAGFPFRKWTLIVGERSSDPRISKSIKRVFLRWMHIFSDAIVSNSFQNIKIIKGIVPFLLNNKTHVIYNILDHNHWKINNQYEPLKKDKLEIVVAATHLYYKNLVGLIEAVNILSDLEKKKLAINWYGKAGNDNSLIDAKKKLHFYNLNHVIKLHDETENIINIYQNCDAVGLFSFFEGLPNTVCEGMMLQKPVIASDISDIPRLIDNHNAIFNPNNIREIKRSLSWLISLSKDQLLEIGLKNKKNAMQFFSKEKNVSLYLKYLENNKCVE